jgi:hypothetical protein
MAYGKSLEVIRIQSNDIQKALSREIINEYWNPNFFAYDQK